MLDSPVSEIRAVPSHPPRLNLRQQAIGPGGTRATFLPARAADPSPAASRLQQKDTKAAVPAIGAGKPPRDISYPELRVGARG